MEEKKPKKPRSEAIKKQAATLNVPVDELMARLGKLGGDNSGGVRPGAGRKRSRKQRCPCGEMTLKRAKARRHLCQTVAPNAKQTGQTGELMIGWQQQNQTGGVQRGNRVHYPTW